ATAGRLSRAKTFQIPDTTVYSTKSAVPMPQPDSIVQVTPMASAPPAGSVLATAVELRFTTAASRSRTAGRTAQMAIQPVTRLAAAATASSRALTGGMAPILAPP